MANTGDGNGIPIERAQFYSHDEVAGEENARAVIRDTVKQLPGLPLFFPLRKRDMRYRLAVASFLQMYTVNIQRPLSREEAQILAQHTHQFQVRQAWFDAFSTGAGVYLWSRGRETAYPIPFRKQPPDFNPQVFTNRLPAFLQIRGPRAFMIWSAVRLGVCVALSRTVLSGFLGFYAFTTMTVGVRNDPRLQPFWEELRQKRPTPAHGRPGAYRTRAAPPVPPMSSPSPPAMSSTSYTDSSQDQGWGDDTDLLDEQSKPETPITRQRPVSMSQTNGSAWERLRRSAGAGGSSTTQGDQPGRTQGWAERRQRAQQANDRGSDSYVDPQSEGGEALARQQAQKEFDAMLERERQGSDGDSRGRP